MVDDLHHIPVDEVQGRLGQGVKAEQEGGIID